MIDQSPTQPFPYTSTDDVALRSLLYRVYETELGSALVYETAVKCALNNDLRAAWKRSYEATEHHLGIARGLLEALGFDPDEDVEARLPVRQIGGGLVEAIEMALEHGTATEAQLTACECVVLAQTKNELNWELVRRVADSAYGTSAAALLEAHAEVQRQDLQPSIGRCRELWTEALATPAVRPPPVAV